MPLDPRIVEALRSQGQLSDETAARFNPPVEPRIIPEPAGTTSMGTSMTTDPAMYASNEPVQDYGIDDDSMLATDIVPAAEPVDVGYSVGGGFGNYDDAFRIQQEGLAKSYGAQAKQAGEEAKFQKGLYEESERQRADSLQKEADENAMLDEKFSVLNQKMDEYAKNPKTLSEQFAKSGTGQKIVTGIALFLGSAPNSAGQNKAVMAMQSALDDDLKAQEQDVSNYKGLYNDLKNTFGDRRQARQAATIAYINNAQIKLQQIASQYKSPIIQGNYEMLFGKLEEEKEKFKKELQLNWAAAAAKARESQNKQMETYVEGRGFAADPTDARASRDYSGKVDAMKKIVSEMKNLRKNYGNEVLNRSAIAKAKQLSTDAKLIAKDIKGLGVLAGPDMAILESLIPENALSPSVTMIEKLNGLDDFISRNEQSYFKAKGLSPTDFNEQKKNKRKSQDTPLE